MKFQPIPIAVPSRQLDPIAEKVNAAAIRVIEGGWWLKGKETSSFEEEFAAYCGSTFCLAVANGTDGLELALRAVDATASQVVTVANAGGYTTTASRLVGAVPSYVDIDPGRLVLDVSAAIAGVTAETRAIVATHLFGNVVDVGELRRRLVGIGRSDIAIIEDCSQAHGASVDGEMVGSLGDVAVFSFYPTKNLGALGDAGAVVCRDAGLHDTLLALHQYGWTERYESTVHFGRNSRMDEIQAAILRIKLPLLADWNEERRRIARAYAAALGGSTGVLVNDVDGGSVVHLAVVRSSHRDTLRDHLTGLNIGTAVHFPILDCDQESQDGLPRVSDGLVETRRAVGEILTIPCFPGMSEDEIQRVVDSLLSFRPEEHNG